MLSGRGLTVIKRRLNHMSTVSDLSQSSSCPAALICCIQGQSGGDVGFKRYYISLNSKSAFSSALQEEQSA